MFSLIFYAWGEVFYVAVMIVSIITNYCIGRLIFKYQERPKYSKLYISIGIIINITLLIYFKYANFITDNVNIILSKFLNVASINLYPVHLPLGISFFTFQAISYLIDVYKKDVKSQKNIANLALYISLFPQLIAGPIVRYHDVARQITSRSHSFERFASGVRRFVFGLAKKMLLANPLGEVVDSIFLLSGSDLTMPLSWIGIIAYTMQIYFDFSGYSDMAIGLGRMFGFRFLENFNYPYISTSIREFWRRWHISLSTWFRDYVYIPLGGSRVSTIKTYTNLFIVFVLVGFWHGANWNFLVWGLLHGAFLASEHAGFSEILKKIWKPAQHAYVLIIVTIGWVFFRSESLPLAIDYLKSMIDITNFQTSWFQFAQILSHESVIAFIIGIILSMPVYPYLNKYFQNLFGKDTVKFALLTEMPELFLLSSLLFFSILKLASSTYNPFIYFRF